MNLKEVQERNEASSYFKKWADENRGKMVVVFGEPLIGKTTFVRQVLDNEANIIWFKVDTNYKRDELPKHFITYEIDHYSKLLNRLTELNNIDMKNKWIVIDSITSLSSDFLADKMLSPRKNVELANFYDMVFRKLSLLKEKGASVLIIAHEAVKSFQPYEIGPKMNINALRHVDRLYRIYKNEKGARVVKKWKEREKVENAKFYIEV